MRKQSDVKIGDKIVVIEPFNEFEVGQLLDVITDYDGGPSVQSNVEGRAPIWLLMGSKVRASQYGKWEICEDSEPIIESAPIEPTADDDEHKEQFLVNDAIAYESAGDAYIERCMAVDTEGYPYIKKGSKYKRLDPRIVRRVGHFKNVWYRIVWEFIPIASRTK